jgi:hypothetical protein
VVEADPAAVRLLPADAALPQLLELALEAGLAQRLLQGQAVRLESDAASGTQLVRLYGPGRQFLGVGRAGAEGGPGILVKPVRLFNDLGADPT